MDRPEILIRCTTEYKKHRHVTRWGHKTCFLKGWGCRLAMAQGKRRHLLWQPPWHRFTKQSCGRHLRTIPSYLMLLVKSIFRYSSTLVLICQMLISVDSRKRCPQGMCLCPTSGPWAAISWDSTVPTALNSVCKARAFGAEPRCGALT